jgi:hypothetical protein
MSNALPYQQDGVNKAMSWYHSHQNLPVTDENMINFESYHHKLLKDLKEREQAISTKKM